VRRFTKENNSILYEKRFVGRTMLHNCTIEPHQDFKADADGKIAMYLARPWKEYLRTLFIQNDIGGFIDPKGWLEWVGTFGLDTLFYADVDKSKRAKWGDIKIVTYEEAQEFTVETFI
jgi:pectinesterase